MNVGKNKIENVSHAVNCIKRTVSEHKPQIIALPECFNSPYGTKYFDEYAEAVPDGYTCGQLSAVAKEHGVYIIGGSIPERCAATNKLFNTCTIWSPAGDLIGKFRKVRTHPNKSITWNAYLINFCCRFTCSTSMWKAASASRSRMCCPRARSWCILRCPASKSASAFAMTFDSMSWHEYTDRMVN